tara:strand:+ start:221 stop:481 length:261 start_codon:yes stop_codon:yes gene_type:complete
MDQPIENAGILNKPLRILLGIIIQVGSVKDQINTLRIIRYLLPETIEIELVFHVHTLDNTKHFMLFQITEPSGPRFGFTLFVGAPG